MTTNNELSDSELVLLLGENSQEAFRILYDRYWKKMLVKAFTQLQSHVDAEEVVQDAFINLWRRRDRLQIRHSFHTYIAAVVRYEVMAKIACKKKALVSIEDVQTMPVLDDSTQEWLDFSDLQREIEDAVEALPEKCRLVFRMSRNDGLSERQISEELDIAQKTVEAHMSNALKKLRTKFSKKNIFFFYKQAKGRILFMYAMYIKDSYHAAGTTRITK
jgi:RNA polymerase sigma-70 factor (family 1)